MTAKRHKASVLDRIDSYLFVPAVVYTLVTLVLPWVGAA